MQMGDTHNDMQPANLVSVAYEKSSFVKNVGSYHGRQSKGELSTDNSGVL
jgi:hypothetical protein